ncbi:MAG: class I SAM-dependent methyltransferase [Candidatus Hermodarchaeota archaeon]
MQLIKPKEFFRHFPVKKFENVPGVSQYVIPIFGKIFYGRIKRILKLFINLKKNCFSEVLDIGGGCGFFSANFKINFPMSKVHLLEILNNKKVRIAKYILNNRFDISLDYYFGYNIQKRTDFQDNKFDLIFALDVLEHIHNIDSGINEIIRILKPGGILFISVPIEGKLLKIIRLIISKFLPIKIDIHWRGTIKSENKFFDYLKNNQKLKIIMREKFPFRTLPEIFSYDSFYLVRKL